MIYLPDIDYVRNIALQTIVNDISKIDSFNDIWLQSVLYLVEYNKSLEQKYHEFYLKNYWPKQTEVSDYYVMGTNSLNIT